MNYKTLINNFKKIVFGLFAITFLFIGVFQSYNVQAEASINDLNVLDVTCIVGKSECLLEKTIDFLLSAAIPLAVLVIMWGGYKYFFSGLVEGQSDGKKTISAGVIGLVIVLIARVITTVIQGSINANGLTTAALTPLINNLTDFLFGLAAVVTALVIVWGGYQYLFSGLPGSQKTGQENIQRGITGLIIILLARAIADIVKNTINGDATLTLKTDPIVNFLKLFISGFFIPIVSVITVFFFVLGGYYLITANGNKETETKGRSALQNAVIGLIVVLLSTTIAQLIVAFVPTTSSSSSSTSGGTTTPGGGTTTPGGGPSLPTGTRP